MAEIPSGGEAAAKAALGRDAFQDRMDRIIGQDIDGARLELLRSLGVRERVSVWCRAAEHGRALSADLGPPWRLDAEHAAGVILCGAGRRAQQDEDRRLTQGRWCLRR
jgi:hypothetical protein